jgi:hypothetical protein
MNQAANMLSFPTEHKPLQETPRAAAAFREYCLLGPDRSLAKLAAVWGKKQSYVGQLQRWSSAYGWVARAKEYDSEQAEEKRKRRQVELERMDEQHARIGHKQLLRSIKIIKRHIDEEDTTLSSAVSLMKAAYELERLARGAATSRLEGDVSVMVLPKEYINIDPGEEGSEL